MSRRRCRSSMIIRHFFDGSAFAVIVIPYSFRDGHDVIGEVHGGGCDEHGNDYKEDKIEYELFGRSQHVQREGDFVLVLFESQPPNKS